MLLPFFFLGKILQSPDMTQQLYWKGNNILIPEFCLAPSEIVDTGQGFVAYVHQ